MLLESDISTKYVHVKWMKMNDSKMARFFSKKNLGGPIASVVYNGLDKLSFDVKIPLKKTYYNRHYTMSSNPVEKCGLLTLYSTLLFPNTT